MSKPVGAQTGRCRTFCDKTGLCKNYSVYKLVCAETGWCNNQFVQQLVCVKGSWCENSLV